MKMEERREYIDELILSYLADGLSEDGLQELKRWMAASAENEKYFFRLKEIWSLAVENGQESFQYDKEKAFQAFKKRVSEVQRRSVGKRKEEKQHALWAWGRYAAVVAVLCVVSYLAYWYGSAKVKADFAEIVVEAPLGSRTKLFLPDGTLVWLNSGSRMTYSQGFGVEDRLVNMMGEGYFEVKPNKELPFEVKTQALRVRVLGTKFNFRDYSEDDEAIVSLLEGKVALDNLIQHDDALSLMPNERVVLDKKSGKMQLGKTVAANSVEWTKGYLFFDEELLSDIVKELERSYNVKIDISNEVLNDYRFYGNFVRRRQSIQEVLEALSATGKIHYKMDKDNIILY